MAIPFAIRLVKIELTTSNDSLFHVSTRKYASGITRKKAYRRIDNISHNILIDSNLVQIDPVFEYPAKDCIRRQKVVVRIEVPEKWRCGVVGRSEKSLYHF